MSDPIAPLLRELLELPGLSGSEEPVRERMRAEWKPLVDQVSQSPLGSLQALKRGDSPEPRPGILLAAHMDSVGLMITGLVEGWLRVTQIGHLDPRVLPGQLVIVHGRRDLPGVVVLPPARCLPEDQRDGPPELQSLLIDVGLSANQVRRWVRPGDPVSFEGHPFEMGEDLLVGHSLDNRASLAALTVCLQEIQGRSHAWDVHAVATAFEEVHMGGALTSGFAIQPAAAVAVDVTYARGLGQPEHKTFALRGGPTNGWGPDVHPGMHRAIQAAAERLGIPLNVELMPQQSGTDAFVLQTVAQGIPTGVLSIPLRYMHTPVEIVALSEIRRAGALLAELITGLEANFLDTLVLE